MEAMFLPNHLKKATTHFDNIVRGRLEKCENADQMLEILAQEYDLTKKLGVFTKTVFIQGLKSAVGMIDPEIKDGI